MRIPALNLALYKRTCSSSILDQNSAMYGSHLAVDGENSTNINSGRVCFMAADYNTGPNWFMVNLEVIVSIRKVRILPGNTLSSSKCHFTGNFLFFLMIAHKISIKFFCCIISN